VRPTAEVRGVDGSESRRSGGSLPLDPSLPCAFVLAESLRAFGVDVEIPADLLQPILLQQVEFLHRDVGDFGPRFVLEGVVVQKLRGKKQRNGQKAVHVVVLSGHSGHLRLGHPLSQIAQTEENGRAGQSGRRQNLIDELPVAGQQLVVTHLTEDQALSHGADKIRHLLHVIVEVSRNTTGRLLLRLLRLLLLQSTRLLSRVEFSGVILARYRRLDVVLLGGVVLVTRVSDPWRGESSVSGWLLLVVVAALRNAHKRGHELTPVCVHVDLVDTLLRHRNTVGSNRVLLLNLHSTSRVLLHVFWGGQGVDGMRRIHARHVVGEVEYGGWDRGIGCHSTSEKIDLISHGMLKIGHRRSHDRAVPGRRDSPTVLFYLPKKAIYDRRRSAPKGRGLSFLYWRLSIQRGRISGVIGGMGRGRTRRGGEESEGG